MKTLAIVALLSLICLRASAQYYSAGQDAATTRWMQVKTDHARFVFPQSAQSRLLPLISTSDSLFRAVSATLWHRPARTNILFHTGDVISNGFTSWAPRRIEIYTTSPQDNDGNAWLRHVLLHEYRHHVQIDKLNRSATRALTWVFGEQATGAVLGLYVPLWFLEGDAVVAETELSPAGRGRYPAFAAPLRAQLREYGAFSYEKAYFGSYRDFVPDHYVLGYHLVAYTRLASGADTWATALRQTGSQALGIGPMSASLRRQTGKGIRPWYYEAMATLDSAWQAGETLPTAKAQHIRLPEARSYTSYRRPQQLGDGSIVAERHSLDDIDRIVRISPEGEETILATPGAWFRESLTANDGLLAWVERRPHPRWEQEADAVIVTHDLSSGKTRRITKGSQYFSPAISPDGKRLAVVESPAGGTGSLLVLNASTGAEVMRYAAEDYPYLSYPSWHPDGKSIIVVGQKQDGRKTLLHWDIVKGTFTTLLPPGHTDINYPTLSSSHAFFTGSYSGEEALYMVALDGDAVMLAAQARYGLTDPSVVPGTSDLLACTYTADGYRPVRFSQAKLQPRPIPPANAWMAMADSLARQVPASEAAMTANDSLRLKPYRKGTTLFHFHSWAPLHIDVDARSVNPGFSLFSQNLLSTSFLSAGYEYLPSEDRGEWYLRYAYEGWLPRIGAEVRTGHRRGTAPDNEGILRSYAWQETTLRAGADLPLRGTKGPWFLGVVPSVRYARTWLDMDDDSPFRFRRETLNSTEYRIYGWRQMKAGRRDLQPRWAQVIDLNYRHDPWHTPAGHVLAAEAYLYAPGIARHHGLLIYGGWQRVRSGSTNWPVFLRLPTGWSSHGEPELGSLSLDYRFPVAYPDWNLPGVIFIQRIKGGLFYERARGTYPNYTFDYTSIGGEIRIDAHLFRFLAPFDIGYRLAWRKGPDKLSGALVLAVDFTSFTAYRHAREPLQAGWQYGVGK